MSTAAQLRPATATTPTVSTQAADVLVVFGITGDLAKVMTFHSLYRLERRGLLDCPILGVAAEDWTIEDLRKRARTSIEACGETIDEQVFKRFADRLSYLSGDFTDEGLYARVASALGDAHSPVFYLEIPPFLFGTVIKGLAGVGATANGRVVVEKPFGHDRASAHALAAEIHKYIDESQLYRIDHFLGKMGTDEFLYLRFGNTMIEPIWNRNHVACVQITMAESFGVEDRGHFYDPVGALRDVVVNHLMQLVAAAAMEAPAGNDAETLKDAKFAVFRSTETADPKHFVRGQYDGYLDIDGVADGSTTETYAALRLDIDNWRWAGVPWFIRTGKKLPITQTELRVVFRHPPRLGFMEHGHRRPEPDQLVVKLDPSTGTRLILDAHRADKGGPQAITLDMEFSEEGGEAPTPYEVLLLDAMRGESMRFTRQDSVEETWRIFESLLPGSDTPKGGSPEGHSQGTHGNQVADPLPPAHPYAPGSWGPQQAERLVAGYGGWHGPWVAS